MATSFNVNVHDLQYILKQIKIAEAHAGGKTLLQSIMDAYGITAANAAQLPAGLRTVDGSLNSLVPGQENFGAADQIFPRLLTPVFIDAGSFAGSIPGVTNTNYANSGNVVDSDPRTISNLIVNQTAGNPAAVMAALQSSVFAEAILPSQVAGAAAAIAAAYGATINQPDAVLRAAAEANLTAVLTTYGIEQGPEGALVIPNLSPDIGLSPGFNAWMTFFGQFFDHGLDLVTKGGNGTVYIPLAADDPLIAGADKVFGTADDLPAHLRFMALTRADTSVDLNGDGDTTDPGETGNTQGQNTTTAFVDQNQTYTSHASHQVFLREYATVGGKTVSTGNLLDGKTVNGSLDGAVANWAEVKASALQFLGIALSDFDIGNVPWLRTDAYGKFIPDPTTGYAQVIVGIGADGKPNTADDIVVSGTPATPINLNTVGALGTGHAFLNDIAHHAVPGFIDTNHNGVQDVGELLQTADTDPGVGDDGDATTYDDEMLNAHFVTGDGRGNENIALTTVHSIFHSEHNRLVTVNKATLIENATTPAGLAFLNEWLLTDVAAVPADLATLVWDGERLFQAARFSTEMQYQHLVFEEFARRVQPLVDPFIFNNSPDVDPSIVAEFAHTVYRFGHSMLTDSVDRLDNSLNLLNGDTSQTTLIAAFLNPQMYLGSGQTLDEANANIIRGLTLQLGNEIDEFVVPALQSNLLGLPLDLPALNMARGRETGVPSLNGTRSQLYNDFGIVDLKPYASWKEFGLAIKNPMSIINFIAAYGTHDTVVNALTLADKRLAAYELVTGVDVTPTNGVGVPADRLAFLNATGAFAGGALGGLNNVDLWVGGLAEKKNEFGGMLGSTFNFIFEYQLENLQNGDRLYYLTRTQGLNFLNNLEPNTFSDLVMRNTALGDKYATHLSGALFITPDHIIELDRGIAQSDYNEADTLAGAIDPIWEGLDPITEAILGPKVFRDYTNSTTVDGTHDLGGYVRVQGGEHYVLGGTEGNDTLLSDSGIDAIWGDGGDDYINAGTESDDVFGGEGDDIIEDPFGDDVLRGNQGNDVITEARGADLVFGDEGMDYIILGQDAAEAFGGEGDDFILGGNGKDFILGNEGNDWIEGGGGFETIAGENSELFFNSTIIGHDVMFGQADETDYDAESGDDIMGSGASVYRYEGQFGFDWAIGKGDFRTTGVDFDFAIPIFTTIPNDILKDRFDQVEAASGWEYDDLLQGDDRGHKGGGSSAPDSVPVELFADHLLTQEGINRIDGFNEWFGGNADGTMDGTDARITLFGGASPVPGSAAVSTFRDGNILMGGNGNDLLRGRGGYDLIDGDAYLNVRIKIVIPTTIVVAGVTYAAGTVLSAESLSTDTAAMGEFAGKVFFTDAGGHPIFTQPAFGGRSLNSLMLDRTINPGSMSIVREILDGTLGANETDIDTAFFQGTLKEYEIEGITTAAGFNLGEGHDTGFAQDVNGDGFIYVRDRDTGAVGATVFVNGVATTLSSRGLLTDDRDLLKNVEQLQFADKLVTIGGGNVPATGLVTISDPTPFDGKVTPYVGQVLTATLSNVADPIDGLTLDPLTGLPVGLTFEWQTTEFGSNSGWSTITTGVTYTVRSVDPGHVLRAVAVFKDAEGNPERIISAETDNPTVSFSVNENSFRGTMVGLQIPFSVDYDSQSIGGLPPVDVDLTTLYHQIDPANDAGDRFMVVPNGVDFNGFPRFSLVVNRGGPVNLDYEALQTPVDNQYQVVINSYSDNPANGGVLVAVRQFTINLNNVEPEGAIVLPTLDLNAFNSVNGTYADNFNGQLLPVVASGANNSTGANAWTTSWTETNDDNNIRTGQIQIDTGILNLNNDMRFGNGDGATITRAVNLTGATSASLSFNVDQNGLDAGETVTVQFSSDGVTFTDVAGGLIDSSSSSTGALRTVVLTGPFTATSAIRFVGSAINGAGEDVRIDNVAVNFATQTAGSAGNNYATTFTENGAAVAIASLPDVTSMDTVIDFATIVLTDWQAGDVLSVLGALPAGITAAPITNVAGVMTLTLTGIASLAAYETAIGQVRFANTLDIPGDNQRTIQATVTDVIGTSTVATTTVTVVSVNDAPVAAADFIVTNQQTITVAESLLLANDTDVDGPNPLDITATGALNGITSASLATTPGSVTIVDNAVLGGSIQYTANDGGIANATGVATVNLTRVTGNTLNGATGANANRSEILIGGVGNDTVNGGGGNDTILGGGGNDTITWGVGGGRDFMDGGAGALDRVVINGDNSVETFNVYSNTDDGNGALPGTLSSAALAGLTGLNANTEIVITRNGVVIAELDNIEEITINTSGGVDTVTPIGNFNPTSLSFNTISVNGGIGSTTVDISGLSSDHRVVLSGDGTNDQIIGGVRTQDVINQGSTSSGNAGSGSSGPVPNTAPANNQLSTLIANKWGHRAVEVQRGSDGQDKFHFGSAGHAKGDTITQFEPGDRVEVTDDVGMRWLSGNHSSTLVASGFASHGSLNVEHESRSAADYSVASNDQASDHRAGSKFSIKGMHDQNDSDFIY